MYSETTNDVSRAAIEWSIWWLNYCLGRMGGSAKYTGMKNCEIPLYVMVQVIGKHIPRVTLEKFIDKRFLKSVELASKKALKDVKDKLLDVKSEKEEAMVLVWDMASKYDLRLSPDERSKQWDAFIVELREGIPPIDKDAASRIAAAYLQKHPVDGYFSTGQIIVPEETGMRAPRLYHPYGRDITEGCWIFYADRKRGEKIVFQSSYIVLVDKISGRVVYSGAARDEG